MSFVKHLRTVSSALPQTIVDGFIYFVRSTKGVYFDYDEVRTRINPPADWNQTNTNDPSYIANKPTTLDGYGITDALSSSTRYAGSPAVGGSANSAIKLDDTNIGGQYKGAYIGSDGKPYSTSYDVQKSVPSDAKFTDTTYSFDTGDDNGQIKITSGGSSSNVSVKGLGSAAYTNSGSYATSTQGGKADSAVQSVKIGSTEYKVGTDVVLPAYPTTLPASDVSAWAKADTKPTYTASEVNAYNKTEIDNMFSSLETGVDWKEAVATYNDIATTYPNPQDGWTVNVKDTDYTYRYNGTSWVAISANAIPDASTSVKGLMTTSQVSSLNAATTDISDHETRISQIEDDIDDGVINLGVELTQDEFDELSQAEKDSGKTYFITDGDVPENIAARVSYENGNSGLTSTKVQGAIDELDARLDNAELYMTTHDSGSDTVGFTSSDVASDSSATSWTSVSQLQSDETHATIFGKVSQMFKNVRYLRVLTGDGNISSIGNGTITGGVISLNNSINDILKSKNTIFGGRSLGSSYTSEQQSAISSGTFNGLMLGDYWTINGVVWRIWGFDWYLNKGDTQCTTHHVVILPDSNLLATNGSSTHYMNDTDTTAGGYGGSKLRSTYVPQMKTTIGNAFGSSHILAHRELLCNAVSNGKASGWAWYDSTVEIPSEVMTYGATIWSNYTDGGSGYNVGTAYPILPLAMVRPDFVINRANYWLRDVVSASWFATVYSDGHAGNTGASNAWVGVRPCFLLS